MVGLAGLPCGPRRVQPCRFGEWLTKAHAAFKPMKVSLHSKGVTHAEFATLDGSLKNRRTQVSLFPMQLFGAVPLVERLGIEVDALGISLPTKIGGLSVQIHTPTLSPLKSGDDSLDCWLGKYHTYLSAPPVALGLKTLGTRVDWGQIVGSSPDGSMRVLVESILLSLDADPSDPEIANLPKTLLGWTKAFGDLLRLMSGQRTLGHISVVIDRLQSFVLVDQEREVPGPGLSLHICVHEDDDCVPVSSANLAQAAELCSLGKVVPLHYQLILRGYDAYLDGDCRSAVIEASTGLEVAATFRIRKELKASLFSDDHVSLLLGGYEALRSRLSLLKKLNVPDILTGPEEGAVLRLRNQVVHGGRPVTKGEAKQHLISCRKGISGLMPDLAVDPLQ